MCVCVYVYMVYRYIIPVLYTGDVLWLREPWPNFWGHKDGISGDEGAVGHNCLTGTILGEI